jgi:release factor glutamine methyltransferase
MLEHGYQQSQQVRTLLLTRGFEKVRSIKDLAGIERVSMGLWPGTQHPTTRE